MDTNLTSRLQNLPASISGERINLWSMTAEAWPRVKTLSSPETIFMAQEISDAHRDPACFTDQKKYTQLCEYMGSQDPQFRSLEPAHTYWMHAPQSDRLVGFIDVTTSLFNRDVLLVGYTTLPDHRKQGHATAAATLLSNFILDNDIAPFVGAGVNLKNKQSRQVLAKAGFQELANELLFRGMSLTPSMRHLIKGKGPTQSWPDKLVF